jgi:hypothetical protein
MGYNIEQYELSNKDNYSNAVGFGCELILRKDKKARCEEARDIRKGNVTPPTVEDEPVNIPKKPATNNADDKSETTDTTKSNTGMYIGIGVGILAIGIVAIVLIKKK